ncbi:MAG: HAD family phosphatase [Lachnospiraceae bacterium]|nr:HAD family phosphatase [Lachnospiraceae bacterium]
MERLKRIAALAAVALLLGIYVSTFVFAISKSPMAPSLFKASLGCTILVPVLLYAFLLAVRMARPSKSAVIDTLIFDVGSVLLYFPWREYAENMDISQDAKDFIVENVLYHPLFAECDLGIKSFEELLHDFCAIGPRYENEIRRLIETMYTCVEPYPYTDSWLAGLKRTGYRLYILSNWSEHAYEKLKENGVMDFEKYMDGGKWSFREHLRKPDRAFFEKLLADYRIDRSRAVFLDDNPENVAAATKLGIRSILFRDYEDAKSRLKELGV